jgi:hypothetical protein
MWALFVNPARRRLYVEWEQVAQHALAKFRISYGLYAGDPLLSALVEDLPQASEEFCLWWPRHCALLSMLRFLKRIHFAK